MKSRTLSQTWITMISGLLLLTTVGCGEKEVPEAPAEVETPVDETIPGNLPLTGQAKFVSQCPHGYRKNLPPTEMSLWECPLPLQNVELAEAPRPMVLMADCQKKTLTVRSEDGKSDATWQVMPDGSFFLTLPDLTTTLKHDGSQDGSCISHLSTDLLGKLECKDREQVDIKLETIYRLNKGQRAASATLPECKVPEKCYMYTAVTLQQCQ